MSAGASLSRTVITRLILRQQIRFLTGTALRSANEAHHSYFRHDSPVVRFPKHSQFANYLPTQEPTHSPPSPRRELADSQKWLVFLGGFLAFPLLCLGYFWGDWAVGSKLWTSDVKQLEEQGLAGGSRAILKSSQDSFFEASKLYNILQRANAETKALHDLILLWINPDQDLHAVKDTLSMKNRPIQMSDGRTLDPSKAVLIRILNKDSKTLVLLLGVDMSDHSSSGKDQALAWCHDAALHDWMDERAEELKKNGEVAEDGLSLYCYTATSSATSLPGQKGDMWQEARLFPEDVPSGFPLKLLEKVKDEISTDVP